MIKNVKMCVLIKNVPFYLFVLGFYTKGIIFKHFMSVYLFVVKKSCHGKFSTVDYILLFYIVILSFVFSLFSFLMYLFLP